MKSHIALPAVTIFGGSALSFFLHSQQPSGWILPLGLTLSIVLGGNLYLVLSRWGQRLSGKTADSNPKFAEKRLLILYEVTKSLVEASSFDEMISRVMRIICQNLKWDLGEVWLVDRKQFVLRRHQSWHEASSEFLRFESLREKLTLKIGEGVAGKVWKNKRSLWVSNLRKEEFSFDKDGFLAEFALPIQSQNEVTGVLVFFSKESRMADDLLLEMFESIGSLIGQFLQRKRLEEQFFRSQKMQGLGRLASGVAHDFNNLLTIILGYCDFLQGQIHRTDEKYDKLMEIRKAAELASNLTKQLLAFGRRSLLVQTKVFNLNDLIEGMKKMLSRLMGEDVKLTIVFAKDLWPVKCSQAQIEQVLINLIINARDAMPHGGKIVIETANVTLTKDVTAKYVETEPGEYVLLAVSDTGIGMTEEVKSHLFEPFFTTKEKNQGTGLGLSTVYGIIQQNRGHIRVYSEKGAGATFRIYLPRSLEPVSSSEPREEPQKAPEGTETILLVEDEKGVREFEGLALRKLGYQVLEASNAEEAISVIQNNLDKKIRLLLTDSILPGMTGQELAEKVKSIYPRMRVILTSGHTDSVVARDVLPRSEVWFLDKPFSQLSLALKVREALDR